jgi:hypothetical protein
MKKICKCGFDIEHPKVVYKTEYTKWGWFILTILGLSAKPKEIKFTCSDCGETIDTTSDPKTLSKYVGR